MGASSFTPNLELPQFASSDKPTWRGDINSAFTTIDNNAGANTLELGTIENHLIVHDDQILKLQNQVDVEIESFDGATDDVKFSNALAAVDAAGGGVIRLRPGKTYNWVAAPTPFDFETPGKLIVIIAYGAVINANYAGSSWRLYRSTSGAANESIAWFGGTVNNSDSGATEFFLLEDINKSFWFRVNGNVPNGSIWHQSNKNYFSENNHYMECYDSGSKHAITFSIDGSPAGSMARTVIRSLRVQGGIAGEAKVNIGDNTALYHSVIDGVTGNLTAGAIGIRIAGNMHGAVIGGNIGFEYSLGLPSTYAYFFTVGALAGGARAQLKTDIVNTYPTDSSATMKLMHPSSSQSNLYNAVDYGWAVLGVGRTLHGRLDNAATVALAATNEVTIFTINCDNIGEYELDASICVQINTASTIANVQARIDQGTATANIDGGFAAHVSSPSAANIVNQVVTCRVHGYLTVSAPGTVVVIVRASSDATAFGSTPGAGYRGASGYVMTQMG